MDGLFINISWEYFLGIIGTLIGLAYYASSRFTALEIDIGWLKEMISELSIKAENVNAKLFKNGSLWPQVICRCQQANTPGSSKRRNLFRLL
jgi:hypothetical protein